MVRLSQTPSRVLTSAKAPLAHPLCLGLLAGGSQRPSLPQDLQCCKLQPAGWFGSCLDLSSTGTRQVQGAEVVPCLQRLQAALAMHTRGPAPYLAHCMATCHQSRPAASAATVRHSSSAALYSSPGSRAVALGGAVVCPCGRSHTPHTCSSTGVQERFPMAAQVDLVQDARTLSELATWHTPRPSQSATPRAYVTYPSHQGGYGGTHTYPCTAHAIATFFRNTCLGFALPPPLPSTPAACTLPGGPGLHPQHQRPCRTARPGKTNVPPLTPAWPHIPSRAAAAPHTAHIL